MNVTRKFEADRRFFDEHRKEWVEAGHAGAWAVILGEDPAGFFATPREAFEAGMTKYGRTGFMMKQVELVDRIAILSREDPARRPSKSSTVVRAACEPPGRS